MALQLDLEPKPTPDFAYKILTKEEHALFAGESLPFVTGLDTKDGYVHLSTRHQVLGTLQRFFPDHNSVILLEIPYPKLRDGIETSGRQLKWEAISSGAVFPHVYPAGSGKGLLKTDVGREIVLKRGDGWNLDALDA
jgi:uncharacterized protein (DUF952 family)